MGKLHDLCHRLKAWYKNQPDITLIRKLPKPSKQPEPFKLEGEILFDDDTLRTITKQGNSYHVSLPPLWKDFLPSDMKAWLFEAQGIRGLIYVCEAS